MAYCYFYRSTIRLDRASSSSSLSSSKELCTGAETDTTISAAHRPYNSVSIGIYSSLRHQDPPSSQDLAYAGCVVLCGECVRFYLFFCCCYVQLMEWFWWLLAFRSMPGHVSTAIIQMCNLGIVESKKGGNGRSAFIMGNDDVFFLVGWTFWTGNYMVWSLRVWRLLERDEGGWHILGVQVLDLSQLFLLSTNCWEEHAFIFRFEFYCLT